MARPMTSMLIRDSLYRVFEGTVLEGVVTNHISTADSNGPILIMLTTDYYSHDHQQLLMPQGTRLIGSSAERWQRTAAQNVRHVSPGRVPRRFFARFR